jgi:hypothetical protein
MKKAVSIAILVGTMWSAVPAHGQDAVTVNFSNPSRPGLVKVMLFNGGIVVREHSGRDVIFESRASINRGRPTSGPDGLRRIDSNASGLTIEEENNVMTVTTRNFGRNADLEIRVPAKTNLNLKTMNGGDIVVEGVDGEIEVTNMNGGVVLNNVAGSVVAHSANGRVAASLREVTPNKPMSFTSFNGNVDLTLPANARANLKMRTDNGEAYSDFDVQLRSNAPTTVEDSRSQGRGRFKIQTDRTINGTINGGGPDFDLRTLNGNIYIRKGK